MIQVPVFGMENNPDSLYSRRRAFLTAYGYGLDVDVEDMTEVIGHVPHVPASDDPSFAVGFGKDGICLVTLFSSVVPYALARVRIPVVSLQKECEEYERGNLWTVQRIEKLP